MAEDVLDICLTMKKRVPLTFAQLAEKNPQFDKEYLKKALQAVSESGLVEFHWENLDGKNPNHEKRWVLDMFVPGSAEIMMINPVHADMFPETADFFERMAYLPLAGLTEQVPPGGAGIGMHVIPVEKAIPAESQSLPIEHLSHWLKKYEGHIGVSVCSCRKQQRIRGEGSGDIEAEWCIGVGDFSDYCRETNHGRDITYEEAMEILQKAEDRGYGEALLALMRDVSTAVDTLYESFDPDNEDLGLTDRVLASISILAPAVTGHKPAPRVPSLYVVDGWQLVVAHGRGEVRRALASLGKRPRSIEGIAPGEKFEDGRTAADITALAHETPYFIGEVEA